MPKTKQGLLWETKMPASVYDETGLGLEPLLIGLDMKLQKLADVCGERNTDMRFRSWLGEMRTEIVALVFHAGEIMSEGNERMGLHVISDYSQTKSVSRSIVAARMDILRCSVSDFMGLAHLCTETCGSRYRAFFSGELVIGASSQRDMQMFKMHAISAQAIFEDGNVLCDIGTMVGHDISEKIFYNGNGRTVEISDHEFVKMAKESMKRRRVNPHMHERVLPYAKKALLV